MRVRMSIADPREHQPTNAQRACVRFGVSRGDAHTFNQSACADFQQDLIVPTVWQQSMFEKQFAMHARNLMFTTQDIKAIGLSPRFAFELRARALPRSCMIQAATVRALARVADSTGVAQAPTKAMGKRMPASHG